MKKLGDTMMFSGGAEPTPQVKVVSFNAHGSMNDGKPTFIITPAGMSPSQGLMLSPGTMKAILAWYEESQPQQQRAGQYLKIGDVVTLTRKDEVWIVQTGADIEELRARDRRNKRFHDDGGEPILYSPYSKSFPSERDAINVKVTTKRPTWLGYTSRPTHLVAGYCALIDRVILFRDEGDRTPTKFRFPETFCSSCGGSFGPGDNGYSHCEDHAGKRNLDD